MSAPTKKKAFCSIGRKIAEEEKAFLLFSGVKLQGLLLIKSQFGFGRFTSTVYSFSFWFLPVHEGFIPVHGGFIPVGPRLFLFNYWLFPFTQLLPEKHPSNQSLKG